MIPFCDFFCKIHHIILHYEQGKLNSKVINSSVSINFIVLFVSSAFFLGIRDCNFVLLLRCEQGLMSSSDWEGGPGCLTQGGVNC